MPTYSNTGWKLRTLETETSVRIGKSIKAGKLTGVIFPMGSLEQHGPHLPISTDAMIANYVAHEVCERCPSTSLMPPLYVGCSGEHIGFPGTVSLRAETVTRFLIDVSQSLARSGIKNLFVINGHGGNRTVVDSWIAEMDETSPKLHAYSFTTLDIARQEFEKMRRSDRKLVGHADELETSMMLAIAPKLVDMSKAVKEKPSLPEVLSFERDDMAKVSFGWKAKDLSKSGVIGDPLSASEESGKALLNYTIEAVSRIINCL